MTAAVASTYKTQIYVPAAVAKLDSLSENNKLLCNQHASKSAL